MQVDPFKPTLKAPGSKRLKLKYVKLLSSFAFKFDSRRYIQNLRNKIHTASRAVRVEPIHPTFESAWN